MSGVQKAGSTSGGTGKNPRHLILYDGVAKLFEDRPDNVQRIIKWFPKKILIKIWQGVLFSQKDLLKHFKKPASNQYSCF